MREKKLLSIAIFTVLALGGMSLAGCGKTPETATPTATAPAATPTLALTLTPTPTPGPPSFLAK